MRVIAGRARRIQLKTIDGQDTRPTTDRIKETLFNMIQSRLAQTSFLDCFAGSGGIGIEALSRGADRAVFVEQNPKAADCIRQNLKATRMEEKASVMVCDVLTALGKLERDGRPFDTVFMDPPYNTGWERKVLERLKDSNLIREDTWIIVESSRETEFSFLENTNFCIVKNKEYKTNKHVFIEKKSE